MESIFDGRARLSKQDITITILAILLIWSWGWGHWLPQTSRSRGGRGGVPRYDVVISLYNEDLNSMADTVRQVTDRLRGSRRVIIYSKAERNATELAEMSKTADEVVSLDNIGREGETYLQHIIRNYPTAEQDLADYTLFLQPHLAWHWLLLPRVEALRQETGFMSFGPYWKKECTKDSQGLGFPRMHDIYSSFQGDMCPPGVHLSTWAGQFVVSRKRILHNPLRNYKNLLEKFHAPPEHWIWKEGWGNNEPSNPTLGHVLERSWPVIFDCTDANITDSCDIREPECQCLD